MVWLLVDHKPIRGRLPEAAGLSVLTGAVRHRPLRARPSAYAQVKPDGQLFDDGGAGQRAVLFD